MVCPLIQLVATVVGELPSKGAFTSVASCRKPQMTLRLPPARPSEVESAAKAACERSMEEL
jgi:hypothetical protein